jgi:hypothetical protein
MGAAAIAYGVGVLIAAGGAVYQSDVQRRSANQAIDAEKARQAEIDRQLEEQRKLAEAKQKDQEELVTPGTLDLGEEDAAARRRAQARGKAALIVERPELTATNRPQIGTQAPNQRETGVQI